MDSVPSSQSDGSGTDVDELSAWAKAYEAAEPWGVEVHVDGFFDHRGVAMPSMWLTIRPKAVMNEALINAHKDADELTKPLAELGRAAALDDHDILADVKNAHAIYHMYRQPADKRKPAFFSPQWILDNLDTDQIAILVNLAEDARAAKGTHGVAVDEDTCRTLRDGVALLAESDLRTEVFAHYDRATLAKLLEVSLLGWHSDVKAQAE